jgi:acetyltransferase-like isoleucine patch superfamily enzyme
MKNNFSSSIYQKLTALCYLYYKLKTHIIYAPFFKSFGKGSIIISPIKLSPDVIEMGSNVQIFKYARIEGVKSYLGIKYDPKIKISNNVFIQQNLHLTCANSIKIGENTAIAANVSISDINHPYKDITTPPELQQLEVSSVEIGSNCKIYNNVVILPGVKLGKHNVVGANSVVIPADYPDFCLIAGVPSKIIKTYDHEKNEWRNC